MNYYFFPLLQKEEHKNQVLHLLKKCSKEFIPPLEYRTSPHQEEFTKDSNISNHYYDEILTYHFLLAMQKERIVGLLAFIHNPPFLGYNANYISIVCVDNNFRNQGIAKNLYKKAIFELPQSHSNKNTIVRTWSTNVISRVLLENFGFSVNSVLPNHRGNGIDTIYYKYRI